LMIEKGQALGLVLFSLFRLEKSELAVEK
jgi:hypothetical protein